MELLILFLALLVVAAVFLWRLTTDGAFRVRNYRIKYKDPTLRRHTNPRSDRPGWPDLRDMLD